MIYDLRADRDTEAYRNALLVRPAGVTVDGAVVGDVVYADTEAGVVRHLLRRSGRLVLDDDGEPLLVERRGVVVVVRDPLPRASLADRVFPPLPYVPPPVRPLAARYRPFELE